VTRPLIAYADGPGSPRSAPCAIADATGVHDPEVLLGWTLDDRPWLADPQLAGRTVVAGYALAAAVSDGRLRYVPVRLSSMPRLLAEVRPDVAVVAGVRRDQGLAFAGSVGWARTLATTAATVVVEVADDAVDLGGPLIDVPVTAVVEAPPVGSSATSRPPDDVDRAIAQHVLPILPDEPTMQLGPGGVADAVVSFLDRPIRLWSGLVTDEMARLHDRGLLVGSATAAYAWGSDAIAELASAGRLRMVGVEETHDLTRVSAIDRFVAVNTALQVGLDGSVNVERVRGRVVAAIGGHADYAAAAARSCGGLSVIALRSTTRSGGSTIVEHVEVTSTPRCDVDIVVTEHGVADLRGVDDSERGRRIAAIAAPEHR
jgi:acyl-CoA hydrolase